MVIWKFPLQLKTGIQTIQVPSGTVFLTAAEQGSEIFIWGEAEERLIHGRPQVSENIRIQFTGEYYELEDYEINKYLSTVFSKSGLVYHIFTQV